jgi:hypothetical protein
MGKLYSGMASSALLSVHPRPSLAKAISRSSRHALCMYRTTNAPGQMVPRDSGHVSCSAASDPRDCVGYGRKL